MSDTLGEFNILVVNPYIFQKNNHYGTILRILGTWQEIHDYSSKLLINIIIWSPAKNKKKERKWEGIYAWSWQVCHWYSCNQCFGNSSSEVKIMRSQLTKIVRWKRTAGTRSHKNKSKFNVALACLFYPNQYWGNSMQLVTLTLHKNVINQYKMFPPPPPIHTKCFYLLYLLAYWMQIKKKNATKNYPVFNTAVSCMNET